MAMNECSICGAPDCTSCKGSSTYQPPAKLLERPQQANMVYDKSVVRRIAAQMGWTPPPGNLTEEKLTELAIKSGASDEDMRAVAVRTTQALAAQWKPTIQKAIECLQTAARYKYSEGIWTTGDLESAARSLEELIK